ncbi:MAG: PAS domain S-box protein [Mariniphaga sp.]
MKNTNQRDTRGDDQSKTNQELISELANIKKNFEDLKKLHEQTELVLTERKKELNCLHRIAVILSDPNITVDQAILQIVYILPEAWQFPEITEASIRIGDQTFQTSNFKNSHFSIIQDIKSKETVIGQIEVIYTDTPPTGSQQIFLSEENDLLFSIAEIVGSFIEKNAKETALLKSEDKYKRLIENINDAIYEVKDSGIIIYVSPAIERMLGYQPEEMIGREIFDFVIDADRQVMKERIASRVKLESSYHEYRFVDKARNIQWLRKSTNEIVINEGSVSKMGTLTDITQQKLAELQLQNSELLYRSILHASPDVITITDLEGKILFSSPRALEMFGYENTEVFINHTLLEYIDPSDHQRAIDGIMHMIQHNIYDAAEYKALRSDGSTFDVEVKGEFIRDEKGNPLQLIFVTRDITQRKQTEKKLKETEALFRRMVETINDVIFEVSNDGTILYVSPAIERVLGYSPESITGKNFFAYMVPDDRPLLIKAFTDLVEKDYSYLEYRYLTKSGEIRWVRSSTSPIFENGVLIGGRGTLYDIHERKIADDRLQQSEEKYRSLIESSDAAIILIGNDETVIFSNTVASRPFGLKPEEMVGQKIGQVIPGDEAQSMYSDVLEVIKTNHGKVHEIEVIRGNVKNWYRSSIQPVRNESGVPVSAIFYINDITEHRVAEDKIRKLSSAVEQSPISIVITNLDGNIEYANTKACETTGYTLNELIGNNPRVLKSGETTLDEYSVLWENIVQGKEWKGIFHNKRKNGELYWESSTIGPILDTTGKITNYLAIKEDITERRQMQLSLLKSEERLRQIAESSHTMIYETDAYGLYTYVSPVSVRILGLNPDQVIQKVRFSDSLPEEYREQAIALFNDRNLVDQIVFPLYNQSRDMIWVEVNAIPIIDDKNGFMGYRGGLNDITKRKLAEDELRKFRTISDQSNYGNAISDLNGILLYSNAAFAGMHGMEVDELVGKPLSILHSAEQMVKVAETIGILKAREVLLLRRFGAPGKTGLLFHP